MIADKTFVLFKMCVWFYPRLLHAHFFFHPICNV